MHVTRLQVATPGVSSKSQMAFAEGMQNLLSNETTGKVKFSKKEEKKQDDPPADEIEPKSTKTIAQEKCQEILKELQTASGLASSLSDS